MDFDNLVWLYNDVVTFSDDLNEYELADLASNQVLMQGSIEELADDQGQFYRDIQQTIEEEKQAMITAGIYGIDLLREYDKGPVDIGPFLSFGAVCLYIHDRDLFAKTYGSCCKHNVFYKHVIGEQDFYEPRALIHPSFLSLGSHK